MRGKEIPILAPPAARTVSHDNRHTTIPYQCHQC